MTISRNGSRPTAKAPPEHFTGSVRVEILFQAKPPARAGAAYVTFEPCARSDWHTHPGDVVTVGPNEKHWHGATPTTAMTHIAIQESLDGKAVEWLEKVTDEQYSGSSRNLVDR